MAKGFAKQPNYDREVRLLTKAIESRNLPQLQALVQKFSSHIGYETVANLLTDRVTAECSLGSAAWFWRSILPADQYEEMKSSAVDAMVSSLIDDGLEPGKDFSIAAGGVILSGRAKDAIFSHIPEQHHGRLQDLVKRESRPLNTRSPAALLEESLGVPFFENLKAIAVERAATLSDGEMYSYLNAIISGFEAKHPAMGESFGPWLITRTVSPERLDALNQAEPIETHIWMADLVEATGCDRPTNDQLYRRHLEALAKVWEGNSISVYEMIAAIDRRERA